MDGIPPFYCHAREEEEEAEEYGKEGKKRRSNGEGERRGVEVAEEGDWRRTVYLSPLPPLPLPPPPPPPPPPIAAPGTLSVYSLNFLTAKKLISN